MVRFIHFGCGGITIRVCISHNIVDAYSISKFLNDRALSFRFQTIISLSWLLSYPLLGLVVPNVLRDQHQPCVKNTVVRPKDTVSMNSGLQNPTRFEVAIDCKGRIKEQMVNEIMYHVS